MTKGGTNIVCCIIGAGLASYASPLLAQKASIEDLVRRALSTNAELISYEAEVAMAKGRSAKAGAWKNPVLQGEYGARQVDDDKGFTRAISITQTFEFPGKATLRRAIASNDVAIAELGLLQFRAALAGQIRTLSCQYIIASANASMAERIGARSSALVEKLTAHPKGGAQLLLETRLIEASLAELHKTAKEFVQQREEARIEINRLIGNAAAAPLKLPGELAPPSRRLDETRTVMAALNDNLQIKTKVAALKKSAVEMQAAKWEAAPDLEIGPFFTQDKAGELEENAGVQFSLSIPLWDRNRGGIITSQARRDQAAAELMDARRKVEAQIARNIRSYNLALRQLGQTPENLIGKLQEAAELADQQYRAGAVGVQLYLDIQRELLNSQRIHGEAVLEAWRNLLDIDLLIGAQPELLK